MVWFSSCGFDHTAAPRSAIVPSQRPLAFSYPAQVKGHLGPCQLWGQTQRSAAETELRLLSGTAHGETLREQTYYIFEHFLHFWYLFKQDEMLHNFVISGRQSGAP